MYCKRCGKQIEENSIFCKYCGRNLLDNLQDNQDDNILNANNNSINTNPSIKVSKNNSIRFINIFFIIIVVSAIIFFVPFKQYYVGVVNSKVGEDIVYMHLFNLPEEDKTVWLKPPGGIWGDYKIEHTIISLRYGIRFIVIAILYFISRKVYEKINIHAPTMKFPLPKNVVLTVYILLLLLITIIFTPYVKFVYSSEKLLFTGERGFYPFFMFNYLDRGISGKMQGINIYNIDFRVLFLEVAVLTVIFLIIYMSIRNKTKE